MKILKAVIPFILYAVATFVAMEVLAATGGVPQGWLLFSFPLLVLAYAEAGRAVGFEGISARWVALFALVGGMGHWVAPFFESYGQCVFISIWILVEVGVIACMLRSNVKHVLVWFLVALVALAGEWLLFWPFVGPEEFWRDLDMSVLEAQSMSGRARLWSVGLLSVDLLRNVGLFALAYRWRIKSEPAEA